MAIGKTYLRLDIIYLSSRTEERDLAHFYKCLILVSLAGEYLLFACPKKRYSLSSEINTKKELPNQQKTEDFSHAFETTYRCYFSPRGPK